MFSYFLLDVVVVCRCVSSTDVLLWCSSWSCIDAVCVLLASRHMIAFYPSLFSLYLGQVLCLVCSGCKTDLVSGYQRFRKTHCSHHYL
jgi:hypothetical protein